MSYNVSFISLGCAKNQVNCEQMMALCAEAGYSIQAQPEGCDVVVVNTCGFLASACEEAIENVLEMAELKKAGQVKKILVTGCMTQRYKEDIFHELPEVDGLLGTGSYGDIATAIAEVMEKGEKPCHLGNIHTANQSGAHFVYAPVVCLSADRRGLRQPLRLLRDPLPPWQVPQPSHERASGRGSGAGLRRGEGTDRHRAGHHPVRHGPQR